MKIKKGGLTIEIKDIIKTKREELGLTYEQLGNKVGVGKSTVRKWETGMIENMRRDSIIALSKALNISPLTLTCDIFESKIKKDFNVKVGNKIFEARKRLKLSRAELGKNVNLHESTIKRYEDGQIKTLDIDKIKEFANALDLDPVSLIGWNEYQDSDKVLSLNKANSNDIMSYYNKLNPSGKKEALKRIEELTFIPRYITDEIYTIAAHNDYVANKNELLSNIDDIEDMKK